MPFCILVDQVSQEKKEESKCILWTKDTENEYPKQLVTFNWKGEAILRYDYDTTILTFTVESDDSRGYAVSKDFEASLIL